MLLQKKHPTFFVLVILDFPKNLSKTKVFKQILPNEAGGR